jgi:hypothetical protein
MSNGKQPKILDDMDYILTDTNITNNISRHFPGSLDQNSLVLVIERVLSVVPALEGKKYLLATSSCPDEINRDLDSALVDVFGRPFTMGGLAGIPFVGNTGFGAFAAHVPSNGCLVIFSASHIGFNHLTGTMGMIMREGVEHETTSCGAAAAAFSYCSKHEGDLEKLVEGDASVYANFNNELDQQQNYVLQGVAAHYHEIAASRNPQVALAKVVAKKIEDYLNKMMPKTEVPIVHIHGVQINIEGAEEVFEDDYFCVKSFSLIENGKRTDLLPKYYSERTRFLSHQTRKFAVLLSDAALGL